MKTTTLLCSWPSLFALTTAALKSIDDLGLVRGLGGLVNLVLLTSSPSTSPLMSESRWPNDLALFPKTAQARLAEFLFSDDGLHLSSYRYNMGGGGNHDKNVVTTWESRVESFLLDNGTYDWSRDAAGVTYMKYAQRYHVPDITFFINAAPAAIATNGAACGWNLTTDKIPAFAAYIDTVLSHWTRQGIDIKYISAMNEPDNNRSSCTQEGMAVLPRDRAPLLRAVRDALDKGRTASHVDIIADETSQITTQAFPEDPLWLPAAAPNISNIAVHNYDYPDDASLAAYYNRIRHLTAAETLPPVKFTETCCSTRAGTGSDVFGEPYDPSMANALLVAQYVWQFLTIVPAVSFDWWTAVTYLPCSPGGVDGAQCATAVNDTAGHNSGLIGIDPHYNQTRAFALYPTKRAFTLKHFAHCHRPSSVRHDVPQTRLPASINAVASKSPDGSQWSVLFMNHAMTTRRLDFRVPSKGAKLTRAVTTTNSTDFADVKPLPKTKDGKVLVGLPAQSLVTLQFST